MAFCQLFNIFKINFEHFCLSGELVCRGSQLLEVNLKFALAIGKDDLLVLILSNLGLQAPLLL